MALRPGVLLVHKPIGASSFTPVQALLEEARALGLSRQLPVVHGGALDPFAQGLLALHVGKQAIKLVDLVHAAPKRYSATIAWGSETDTGDLQGKSVHAGDASMLTPNQLDDALARHIGWRPQVPPNTSNKRVEGERAYQKAHRGEAFTLPAVDVYLHRARWLTHALPLTSELELVCKGGFYVRSLARDLGRALGCGAHLQALQRTAIGSWDDPGPGVQRWLTGRELLPWLPSRVLTDDESIALEQQRAIPLGTIVPSESPLHDGFPVLSPAIRGLHGDRLIALLNREGDQLEPDVWMQGGL
jgi:tRNA pseudouridine55 synthase